MRITAAGTKDIIYDTAPQGVHQPEPLPRSSIYTVGSGRLVTVAMLNLDTNGTGQVNSNLLAEFKVINASQVALAAERSRSTAILTLSNVPYRRGVELRHDPAPARTPSTVQATATPGANLLSLQTNLASATDTSIVLNGPAGALRRDRCSRTTTCRRRPDARGSVS